MRMVDPHIHPYARTTDDEKMVLAGITRQQLDLGAGLAPRLA
jgi:hypothetical protein